MTDFALRKIVLQIEEVRHEGGPPVNPPSVRGAIFAICRDPFAARSEPDPFPATEALKLLALDLTDWLFAALGGREGFGACGKDALGSDGGEGGMGRRWT